MPIKLRHRTRKDGKKTYYLDIHHNGKRYRETLKIYAQSERERKVIAERMKTKRQYDLMSNEYDIRFTESTNIRVHKYFCDYYDRYNRKNKSRIKSVLNKVVEFFDPEMLMKSLTSQQCIYFRDYLKSTLKGLSAKTYFNTFKRILDDAEKERIIRSSPAKNVRNVRTFDRLNKQVLTIDEARVLLKTPCNNDEVKRAFLFSYNTGLGYKDCQKLEWNMIQDNKILGVRSKTDTDNTVELNSNAIKLLGNRGNGKVFNLPKYNRFVSKHIKKWCIDAGINKHITFYCARHSFACNLLIYGANLKTVADLMGHTSTSMTEKYLNYVNELKRKAVDNLPEF